ncbi:NAD(P)H-hydrate dehydratase [Cellulomonas gilvus]|uniref:ADP-dependent (S)-NAD(P)H-hydrate dehydratase n=1 Tax=Cellulomonas gilvus (strain ATCC 13127 / NRRL B-14078) TaxID=593907 RepID=F8A4W6_CELGA|nr:NAD(P)H-hydrate dehydratase [Cellulomonas gilvus]AEI12069.1 carbohydrate kinase, YjeF related protein [Cellulomonas gilvus ATCC 13127]
MDADAARPGVAITPALLRTWALPDRTGDKDDRGGVLVIGGARRTPGAALLAGLAALRVGAGRLTLAVAESVAPTLAVATPEAGVLGLPEGPAGAVLRAPRDVVGDEVARAAAVVVGPGLDDAAGTRAVLEDVCALLEDGTPVLLDAFALGVLPDLDDVHDRLAGRLVLTPNTQEAQRLLDDADRPPHDAARAIAERYGAVVALSGVVATPAGELWSSASGHSGLGTSGSGDVLAGAVAGLLAGGTDLPRATCWGVALHGAAGDRLAAGVGPVGFLARELVDALPASLLELQVH